jgi:hypothetical protein
MDKYHYDNYWIRGRSYTNHEDEWRRKKARKEQSNTNDQAW